jgi:hypothetical protein
LAAIATRLEQRHPRENADLSFRLGPLTEQLAGDYRTRLVLASSLVGVEPTDPLTLAAVVAALAAAALLASFVPARRAGLDPKRALQAA